MEEDLGHQNSQSLLGPNTIQTLRRAVFWISFPFGVLNFLLPIYGNRLGASALEIGGFFSAFSIVPALIRPFLGRALDRWGRRPFLLLGLAGYFFATIVFSFSASVAMLTIGRFLQGLGSAFLWIAAFTMIADLSGVTVRGFEFGAIDEASYRGGIIGTSLGLGLVFVLEQLTQWDFQRIWSIMFLVYLLPASAAFLSGWRGTQETAPALKSNQIEKTSLSPQLAALMGIVFFTGASQAMVWPLLMIFLQDRLQATIAQLALAYLPAALLSSFLPSRMGKVADRWGRKGPMIAGLVIGSLASLAIPHLGGIWALTGLWCLETLGYTISIPAERAFVADIAGVDIRGTSYGLYTFAYFLGSALGPLLGGWLYDEVGKAAPFYLNTVALLIGALLVGFLLNESKDKVLLTESRPQSTLK